MRRAYLGLGSNLGERLQHLRAAITALRETEGVSLVGVSSVYSSEPVGIGEQPEFLNAVVVLDTDLEPRRLLALAQEIEVREGRRRKERWGPRTLDVDILLYDDMKMDDPALTIPHPRLAERRFVLEPLCEVAPEATLPDGSMACDILADLTGAEWVRREEEMGFE